MPENRLSKEKSPYLLHHASNPVEWHPWSDEAFFTAEEMDRPVFLSIGYSSCHWCHVMEKDCFEDVQVAELLNEAFICVKVDREERPDIDGLYMSVCQHMTGGGGWPLTIIMTPDRRPFFAATYLPKYPKMGLPGLIEIIPKIKEMWRNDRANLMAAADDAMRAISSPRPGTQVPSPGDKISKDAWEPTRGLLQDAYEGLVSSFDERHGGFGTRPKFPSPHNIMFLLRFWSRTGNENALRKAVRTLTAMSMGGIRDQLAGGFHRYSTDEAWLVPHFEKMLYDQAMMALAYTQAFEATKDASFADTARDTISFVLKEMTTKEGAFISSIDADSEGVEGRYYLWTKAEVKKVLGKKDAEFAIDAFGMSDEGNFDEGGEPKGANVLHMPLSIDALASHTGDGPEKVAARLMAVRGKLLEARRTRQSPDIDDKVLADWNGLMIAALARASRVFGEPSYARVAERAASFVLERMKGPEGRPMHRYKDGEAGIPAMLEDGAFMTWGLIELHQATLDGRWLKAAIAMKDDMVARFWDEKGGGGFFMAPEDEGHLPVRIKAFHDEATPSGQSVAVHCLFALSRLVSDRKMHDMASATVRASRHEVASEPWVHCHLMNALDLGLGPSFHVMLRGDPEDDEFKAMLAEHRKRFLPNVLLSHEPAKGARATAQVCTDKECREPTSNVKRMLRDMGIRE